MDFIGQGRLLRMVRIRRGWRQADVASRSGLSCSIIGRHENGEVQSLRALERHAAVFSLRIRILVTGRGGEMDRLRDDEHAAIGEVSAGLLRELGFEVEPEVSFNEWGERGRFDLLAFDRPSGTLVVVEVKTELTDLQDLFGILDVKERLASRIATQRGWKERRRVTVLVVAATPYNRQIVRKHPSLFAGFAVARMSRRVLEAESRVLVWLNAGTAGRSAWLAARRRIRVGARDR